MNVKNLYAQWLANATEDPDLQRELQALTDEADIFERFYRNIAFGTGGLRGVLGAGTNRMNIYVIRRATQGLCNYLKRTNLPQSVAIGYDSRIKSDLFALEAARVLAANGITAWLYPRLQPTPALSWAVRYLKCGAGICVTASHNPAKYNGYKVYGSDGGQLTLAAAAAVLSEIEKVDMFRGVNTCKDSPLIKTIPEACLEDFLEAVKKQSLATDGTDLKVVYSPLNGAGLECVTKILGKIGIQDVTVVPSQALPDGNFPTCPYPNPEIREAMEEGLRLCRELKPDLLLATDPDCDRMGIAVPKGEDYVLITGNEMGVLLLDYICRRRLEQGTMPENPVAVTTIVSTDMADAVAAEYGVELRRVLTGFKFIGEQIAQLESRGHSQRYILGFEESYGYLSGAHVRDKDAVNASMLCCEMAAWYRKQGMTLYEAMESLYKKHGFFRNSLASFAFEGSAGMEKMKNVMESLRSNPPKTLNDKPVSKVVDYATGYNGLPKSDVLEFQTESAKVLVRPSGTEPKLKIYLSARATNPDDADSENQANLAEVTKAYLS